MNEQPVFYDVKGRRQRQAVGLGAALGLGTAVLLTAVVIGLFLLPFIPGLPGGKAPFFRPIHPLISARGDQIGQTGLILRRIRAQLQKQIAARNAKKPNPKHDTAGPIVAAFYSPDEDTSLNSLQDNAKKLTHLMPTWLLLTPSGDGLDQSEFDVNNYPKNEEVEKIAVQNGLLVYPVLSNLVEGIPDVDRVRRLLDSNISQVNLVSQLVQWLKSNKFEGINIDFEELSDADYKKFPSFLALLTDQMRRNGFGVSFDLETGRIPEAATIAANVDFVILMDYDHHSERGKWGDIASLDWFANNIDTALEQVPAEKLVIGIGNYGYDWNQNNPDQAPDSISYQDAVMLAQEARDDLPPWERITFDQSTLNSTFEYDDDSGNHHDVWLLDGPSAYNQYRVARDSNVRGEALWELGTEDPTLWNFYNVRSSGIPDAKPALTDVSFPYEINFQGPKPGAPAVGEILEVPKGFGVSKPGKRDIKADSDGYVNDARYITYPTPIVIDRIGKDPHKPPFEVALTFDDGPDGTYSPEILSVLEKYQVPGTFFVIGKNAISHPGVLRREYADGDEIGGHTFTHPNMGAVSDIRARLEFDATQRAIQSIVGRSTLLFRCPYNADVEPTSGEEVRPVVMASDLGYYTVGESIDPQDWSLDNPVPGGGVRKRTADEMAHLAMLGVKQHQGTMILLHDGGGDRHLTVQALEIMIPQLKAQGYKFVSVSALLGKTRDQIMPPLTGKDLLLLPFDRIFFYSWYAIATFLTLAFLIAIALGIGRILIVTPMAVIANRKKQDTLAFPAGGEPFVSVIIAAFNEEEVIVRTVQSVLASIYKAIEVIVVDDGSRDHTYDLVRQSFAGNSLVTCLRQDNGGKASALNRGMTIARGDVFVYLDADTILASDAIDKLIRHFANPRVGAVAGNVKVGNRINTLTRLQAVEYIASQNLDRRAYADINAVTVVPGAIGAWRKTAIEEAGGYTSDTLAEDMDLTWRVRLAGWKIDNESSAIAYTEAPAGVRAFFKQRFRWTFGTLQCLFKHRDALGRKGLFGRAVLPGLWIYQFGLQVIAPFVDVQLLVSVLVFAGAWVTKDNLSKDWRPLPDATQTMAYIGFMYALFFLIELVSAFIAFRMDREKMSLLWWLFLQRIVYRQILYLVVWKALWTALKGARTGWGKVERRGTVRFGSTGVGTEPEKELVAKSTDPPPD